MAIVALIACRADLVAVGSHAFVFHSSALYSGRLGALGARFQAPHPSS